jgi:hypothetical protein
MSDTTVFVDDAVLGRLPMVCVRTGAPADGLHRIHQRRGGLSGWAFLLLFLGPIGIVVLVVLAVTSRSRDFVVRLPYAQRALDSERQEFRAAIVAFAATVLLGMAAAWIGASGSRSEVHSVLLTLAWGAAAAGVVATLAFAIRFTTRRPAIDLDASGRWVNLSGVHPAFAAAARDEQVARRVASS